MFLRTQYRILPQRYQVVPASIVRKLNWNLRRWFGLVVISDRSRYDNRVDEGLCRLCTRTAAGFQDVARLVLVR